MKALAALLGAAFTVMACYGLGSALAARLGARLRRQEKFPLAFVLGASVLHLAVFAVMALKVAYKPVLILLLAAATAVGIVSGSWRLPARETSPSPKTAAARAIQLVFGGIAAAFTTLYLFNAWAPEISADGTTYHLALMARYLRARGFEAVTTNMYASLSEGVEMLFVPAFAIGRNSAAALVHFAFLIALALAVLAYGHRIGRPLAGAAAALLVYLSPIAGLDGTSAYIDVATAAIVFSVFYWTQIWDEERNDRLLICIGLLGGYAYAAKYTAFVMPLYAAAFVVWRSRRVKPAAVIAAASILMVAPWVVRDWLVWSNPIAPFANRYFHNPNIHISLEQSWSAYLRTYGIENLWALPLYVTWRGGVTGGILGPVFLAAPLALLALRNRAGRRLLAPCVLLLGSYFGNVGTRFLIPMLPFVSLALAIALESTAPVLIVMVMAHALLSWPRVIPRYASVAALQGMPWKAALRIIPEDQYLRAHVDYVWARMIEEQIPPGERVFVRTPVAEVYTSREVLMGYTSAFNEDLQDLYDTGWYLDQYPSKHWIYVLPAGQWHGIRLVETGAPKSPSEQWSVHEVRFLYSGLEVPQRPEWRLRASPNPWDVRLAFDKSEATRWRSWETMRPGMFIEVDFGRGESVDQVLVELSTEEWNVRMRLEALDAQGRWNLLPAQAGKLTEEPTRETASLRHAVSREFHARGVNYLLLKDDDWGAQYVAADPSSWGLTQLAHAYGARVYRVNP